MLLQMATQNAVPYALGGLIKCWVWQLIHSKGLEFDFNVVNIVLNSNFLHQEEIKIQIFQMPRNINFTTHF